MATNGYDQTYEDDRKENLETRGMVVNPVKQGLQYLKDKVLGTDAQNAEASARMKAQDAKSPDTAQAKVNKLVGYKKGGKIRGHGIESKGKTKGRFC
jgi:SLT domain-containing protein